MRGRRLDRTERQRRRQEIADNPHGHWPIAKLRATWPVPPDTSDSVQGVMYYSMDGTPLAKPEFPAAPLHAAACARPGLVAFSRLANGDHLSTILLGFGLAGAHIALFESYFIEGPHAGMRVHYSNVEQALAGHRSLVALAGVRRKMHYRWYRGRYRGRLAGGLDDDYPILGEFIGDCAHCDVPVGSATGHVIAGRTYCSPECLEEWTHSDNGVLYCEWCSEEVSSPVLADMGIGSYEYCGAPGVDVQMAVISPCCEGGVFRTPACEGECIGPEDFPQPD
jgi:hypothetical protein